jgi:hypothetical protein
MLLGHLCYPPFLDQAHAINPMLHHSVVSERVFVQALVQRSQILLLHFGGGDEYCQQRRGSLGGSIHILVVVCHVLGSLYGLGLGA